MAATARIIDFLRDRRPEGPCLVVDLEVIADNYKAFTRAMPDTRIFYAVKANPAPEVLKLLADLGSCFDTASVAEIEMALAAGATPERISYGNTIKKERDVARAHQLGISMFAVDCVEEVEKVSRAAPGARVFCRILTDGAGNVSMTGMPAQEEANRIAEMFDQTNLRSLVINMEHAAFDRGLAQRLASALGGACYNLPELRADTLLHTVKREIDS